MSRIKYDEYAMLSNNDRMIHLSESNSCGRRTMTFWFVRMRVYEGKYSRIVAKRSIFRNCNETRSIFLSICQVLLFQVFLFFLSHRKFDCSSHQSGCDVVTWTRITASFDERNGAICIFCRDSNGNGRYVFSLLN